MSADEVARVVCIGIATLDAIVVVERLPGSDERVPGLDGALAGGGVAATAAVTLARLGIPVAMIGRIGDDRGGRWIRDDLATAGIDTAGLALVAGRRSPLSSILVERDGGARAIVPDPGDAGPIELSDADLERCRAAEWIHLDQRGIAVLAQLRAAGVTTPVSLDDGIDRPEPVALKGIDLYAPTAAVLGRRFPGMSVEDAVVRTLGLGPRIVAATRGADGAVAAERRADSPGTAPASAAIADPSVVVVGPPATDVRSTLGAGDVFHGAFLAGLVEGRPLAETLHRAFTSAALACRALDGRSAIPTAAALDEAIVEMAGRTTDNRGAPTHRSAPIEPFGGPRDARV